MRDEIIGEVVEVLCRELLVVVPPDGFFGQRIGDSEFIFRRAAGVVAGLGAERAAIDYFGFAVPDRVFVKRGRAQIPMQRRNAGKSEFVGAVSAVTRARLVHESVLAK